MEDFSRHVKSVPEDQGYVKRDDMIHMMSGFHAVRIELITADVDDS